MREERGAQGEVHRGLDAEISVTYSSCEGFSNEKRCETNRSKICDYFDLLSINDAFCLEHKCGKAYQLTHISSPTLTISISLFERDKQIKKIMHNSVAF